MANSLDTKKNKLILNTNLEYIQKKLPLNVMAKEILKLEQIKNKWFIILKSTQINKNTTAIK